jgi:hypothetical protein
MHKIGVLYTMVQYENRDMEEDLEIDRDDELEYETDYNIHPNGETYWNEFSFRRFRNCQKSN